MSARATSFWGWGFADKFPAEEALRAIGEQVSGLLGVAVGAPQKPPTVEGLTLPLARLEPSGALAAFSSSLPLDRASHTYGKAYRDLVRGFRGDFSKAPDFVARPRTEDEVRSVLDHCDSRKVAVIPYGGGTG
ncbi:MAG: hypothetical protein ACYC8T_20615, partial [Myxococcaceae bacterium]